MLAAVVAIGCAPRTQWSHPTKPREAMFQDFKDCEREARSIKGPRARAEMRDICMQGKGWQ